MLPIFSEPLKKLPFEIGKTLVFSPILHYFAFSIVL